MCGDPGSLSIFIWTGVTEECRVCDVKFGEGSGLLLGIVKEYD